MAAPTAKPKVSLSLGRSNKRWTMLAAVFKSVRKRQMYLWLATGCPMFCFRDPVFLLSSYAGRIVKSRYFGGPYGLEKHYVFLARANPLR